MYPIVYFDISGKCNARCRWCFSGKNNRQGEGNTGKFIPPEQFERAVRYMLDNRIIDTGTEIKLYNWGEPLLHPAFNEIIRILNENNLSFGISTNASIPVRIDEDVSMKGLQEILFSMPGFSQESYDRIHGFTFERIKKNIVHIVNSFRDSGFSGSAIISYHVYQFNIDELREAVIFAKEHGIFLTASFAYFANWRQFRDYLTSEMDYAVLKAATQDLFLYYMDTTSYPSASVPELDCPQNYVLTLDEECNVLTCCVVNRDNEYYAVGDLFSLSAAEISLLKRSQPVCSECKQAGVIQNLKRCSAIPNQLINF